MVLILEIQKQHQMTKYPKMRTCKRVCKECPFTNKSAPGWLGPWKPRQILDVQQFEGLFPCHKTINDGNKDAGPEIVLNGAVPVCRGFLASASKSAKLFGQHPDNGPDLQRLQKSVEDEGHEDHQTILARWEFLSHHTKK